MTPQQATGARTDPLTLWSGELAGVRVISLKNSKRIIRVGGTPRLVPSTAHMAFLWAGVARLRPLAPATPIAVPFVLTLVFALKGRIDLDVDNAATSVLDLLMAAGIVADDALCVRLVAEKVGGAQDWHTTITISAAA